jgi:hypothetical protein
MAGNRFMEKRNANGDSMGKRSRALVVIAFLMIVFGIAEVVTGFTHEFFGITTSQGMISTYASATIGALYVAAGLLIFTLRKWAATLAIIFLSADVAGRIALVVTGFYPVNSLENAASILAGTIIAIIFAICVAFRWDFFR